MDYPIHIDTISMELSILYLKRLIVSPKFYKMGVFLSLKMVYISANCADTDEILPYVAFHLGLHCLPEYLLTGIQNEKVIMMYSKTCVKQPLQKRQNKALNDKS